MFHLSIPKGEGTRAIQVPTFLGLAYLHFTFSISIGGVIPLAPTPIP